MDIFEILNKEGFCTLFTNSTEEFLEIGRKLGTIIPSRKNSQILIDKLYVSINRVDKSLSAKYKDEAFPFHTDGAYLFTPPQYIILRSEEDYSDCPTLICQLKYSKEETATLKRDVWLVNGGRGKFYTSIINDKGNLRFDEDCMRPTSKTNKSGILIQKLLKKASIEEIYWKTNLTLIIDNWRLLHSRGDASNNRNRILQRIWINNIIK